MTSNSTYASMTAKPLEHSARDGLWDLSVLLSRLFNELMKVEREHASQAAPYERTRISKGM